MLSVNPGDLVLFSDDFADLKYWTVVKGVWSFSGGVLQGGSLNSQESLIYANNSSWMSYQATANMRMVGSNETSLVVRYTDSSNFYWLGLGCWGHKYSISKVVNGIYQELNYSGLASEVVAGRWYLVSAVAVGSSLQLFVDGVKVLEVQDNSHSIGVVGFRNFNGTMQASHLVIQSKDFDIKIQTSEGGYALAGFTSSFGAGGKDFWLFKIDSAGNQLWNKTYGGLGDEVAYSVIQTSEGGYALAGFTNSFGAGGKDFWLVKTDATGIMLWNKTYGGLGDEVAYSVIQTSQGGYILSGSGLTVNVPVDGPPHTVHDYDGLWHTTDFTIKLSATDDEFTIVSDTYYRINNGSTRSVKKNGQPSINTESTNNKLEYWSMDSLGHEELPHSVLNGVKLDKTAPAGFVLINDDDAITSSISVSLSSGANEATSGVYQVRYSNDGVWDSEAWEFPSVFRSWNLTSGDGTKTVYYQIKDNAGLVSSTYSDTIMLSTVVPTGSIVVNDGDAYTSSTLVMLSLTYTDAFSGVSQVRYSNDGVWDTENWEMPATTRAWSLTSGDGSKSVYYQVKNNVGLTSLTYSDTIILETTPTPIPTPTITPTPSPSPSITPTVMPTATSTPTVSPTLNPTPTPTPSPTETLTTLTPSPSPSQIPLLSPSPLSPLKSTALYLYAVAVIVILVISTTIIVTIKKRRDN